MNYLYTKGGIHLIINGKPLALHKSDPHFTAVVEALKAKATEAEVLAIIEADKLRMAAAVEVVPGIEMKGGQLYHQGEAIAGVLGSQMLQMLEEGFDLAPMKAFLDNLQNNPSMRVVEHLYAFLEHGKNPITEDGCFLAYKAVRGDFLDIYSGTFDNSVGQVLKMARNKVDENQNNTCSNGFHVCSFDYLPHFASANGHVMVCKVSPADVVAIPADYHNTKMRVCKYEVVGEHEGYYSEHDDTLASASVANDGSLSTFSVERTDGAFDSYKPVGHHARLSTAAQAMEALLEDSSLFSVRIVNQATGHIVSEQENDGFDDGSDNDYDDSGNERFDFYLFRATNGGEVEVGGGFDTLGEAVTYALEEDSDSTFVVRENDGSLVKTIS